MTRATWLSAFVLFQFAGVFENCAFAQSCWRGPSACERAVMDACNRCCQISPCRTYVLYNSNSACPIMELLSSEFQGGNVCWYEVADCAHPNNPHVLSATNCGSNVCECVNMVCENCMNGLQVPGPGGLVAEFDVAHPNGPSPIIPYLRPNGSFTRRLRVSDPAAFRQTLTTSPGYTIDPFNAGTDIVRDNGTSSPFALYRVRKDNTEKVQGFAFRLTGSYPNAPRIPLTHMSFTEGLLLGPNNIYYHTVGCH